LRVIFRVDSSFKIGTGHVMRCLTLAEIFKENNHDVEFICRKNKGNLINKIRLKEFKVHLLDDVEIDNKFNKSQIQDSFQAKDADECINIVNKYRVDLLIIDHYLIDNFWETKLKPYCHKLIVIDDLAKRKHVCDILLDQTFGRKEQDYSPLIPKDCKLLLGSKYALLRPDFYKWREFSLNRRDPIKLKRLLINVGGFDNDNITSSILQELQICNLPKDVSILVVMSKSSLYIKDIQLSLDALPYETEVRFDVENMAELMANADIAIGASGSSSWERCCLGLPTIQIISASNQTFLAKMLEKNNIVKLITDVREISKLMQDAFKWMKKASIAASKICDGNGGYRVFNNLSDFKVILDNFGEVHLCNYINLNEDEKNLALKMRNHPQVKKWMYSQEKISKKNHHTFIENLSIASTKRYFLVKYKSNIVGVINFSEIDICQSAKLGIFKNLSNQFKFAGQILELASSHYAFDQLGVMKIKLEVFADNDRAINFYKKKGYKSVFSKIINNHEIIHMEKNRSKVFQ
jgi:UDP-2,4-diacetamido-2,4,6-trideoxy-beta-L-altropyranose hydrolase/UDP-4-amino-4,6-dideoxy-N-acetyl-beta-L-altrosamine N-acetyltransferase